MAWLSAERRFGTRAPWRCAVLCAYFLLACLAAKAQRFSAPVTVTLGGDPSALLPADFTGKGTPELLALNPGATSVAASVQVLTNAGGAFSAASTVATAGTGILAMPQRPGALPDLYWVGVSPNNNTATNATLVRASAQQDGSYAAGVTQTLFGTSGISAKLLLAQGGLYAGYANSVVVADATANQLHLLLPNPDGTWASLPPPGAPGITLLPGASQILTADLNGDGLPDIVVAGSTGVQVFFAVASSGFTGLASSAVYPCTGTVHSIALADMDGDGHADLLVEGANGRIDIYHGNADGTFASVSEVGTGADDAFTGHGGRLVGVADLDHDGIPDLVLSSGQNLTVLLGTGSRNYQLAATYALGSTPTSFVFTDLNGDGKPDIAFDSPQGVSVMFASNTAATGQLTASPEPSDYGAAITLTLQLNVAAGSPAPTGSVNFSVDGTAVGTGTLSGNQATYTINTPAYVVGQHTITADYSGDANYTAATYTGTHTIQGLASTSTITDLVTPIYYGQEIGYTNGIDAVVAAYPADPGAPPAGATLDGGLIYVYLDGKLVCSLTIGQAGPTGGPQRCNDANFMGYGAGTHSMIAAYQGNSYYAPSTSITYSVQILPDDTTTALATSLTPAPAGTPVSFTATVTAPYATPVGTVQFFDGATLIGTGTLNPTSGTFASAVTFTSSALALGTHAITANYIPLPVPGQDPPRNFNASQNALTQVIYAVPALTLTSSRNPSTVGEPVTFIAGTASSSAVAFGYVVFAVDGQPANTVALNAQGTAAYTTSSLTVGSHLVTASYSPDGVATAGIGASLTQVVNAFTANDFTLTVTPGSIAVGVGNNGALTVTVTESGSFQEPVNLGCSGLPNEATCTFAVTTIASGGGTTQLLLHPEAPHNCGSSQQYFIAGSSGRPALCVAVLAGLLFGLRRRRWVPALSAMMLGVMLTLGGCGWGNCTDLGTRPGTYTFTVSGTSTITSMTRSQAVTMKAYLDGEPK